MKKFLESQQRQESEMDKTANTLILSLGLILLVSIISAFFYEESPKIERVLAIEWQDLDGDGYKEYPKVYAKDTIFKEIEKIKK